MYKSDCEVKLYNLIDLIKWIIALKDKNIFLFWYQIQKQFKKYTLTRVQKPLKTWKPLLTLI